MALKLPIYMDYNATTPLDPRVLEAMMPYLTAEFGNAASKSHPFGERASASAEAARAKIAALVGATDREIVFTSGATESDNLAIKGVAEAAAGKGNHIITCQAEHKAVLDTCKYLEKRGWRVTYLKPDRTGRVSARQVEEAITDGTVLITLMAANNEVGTLHPVADIGELARRRGIVFHCDATQAVGKIPLDFEKMKIDLASLSAHKVYGPKGVGALYVRKGVRVACQMHGGGHERGMRSGTLNVPGVVGFGAACEIAVREMPQEAPRLAALRDRLEQDVLRRVELSSVNGNIEYRVPNTTNLSFAYVEGESLMLRMPDVAVSSGSACTSASLQASHVLLAMDVPEEISHSSLRFSLGRFTTQEEVDYAVEQVAQAVARMRELSPLYDMAKAGVDFSKVQWQHGHPEDSGE